MQSQLKKPLCNQLLVLFAVVFTCVGCKSASEAHRVNAGTAKETLNEVLLSWQRGESPQDWRKRTPQVVVQDMDWLAGAKLIDFEFVDEPQAVDANLHCDVKLKLSTNQGVTKERRVTYLVGTSPVLTVFRSLQQ